MIWLCALLHCEDNQKAAVLKQHLKWLQDLEVLERGQLKLEEASEFAQLLGAC